jgi:hypothetical protein
MTYFKSLAGWEASRDSLHRYSNILSVIEQPHLDKHPKWWHISLLVTDTGLTSHPIPLDRGDLRVQLDLIQHHLLLVPTQGGEVEFDLLSASSSAQLGDQAIAAARAFGLDGDYKTEKFAGDGPAVYDPAHAAAYLDTIRQIDALFKQHKVRLAGETSPVQLWSHHFDISLELFGTRDVAYEEDGQTQHYPSQLNLGWSPGDETHPAPYFYSNPFPFEESLLETPLPHGARWVTEGFKGSLLPYDSLVGDPQGGAKLLAYADAVYQAARPVIFE